jgi:hypothetical protein
MHVVKKIEGLILYQILLWFNIRFDGLMRIKEYPSLTKPHIICIKHKQIN